MVLLNVRHEPANAEYFLFVKANQEIDHPRTRLRKMMYRSKGNEQYCYACLDYRPTNGTQKGVALQDLYDGSQNQKFTLVLNPQNSKNATWLKNWVGTQNDTLTFGKDALDLNGVNANLVAANLQVGDTIYIPLILGPPPFNQDRTIVGVIGLKITRIKFPLEIEGTLTDPTILKGTPGVPVIEAIGQETGNFYAERERSARPYPAMIGRRQGLPDVVERLAT